eukprot:m.194055 g.194055  ORF g.194055 m.194055 type:complete len:331 (-) comp19102_c0_seq1:436-1428(-)
MDATPSDLMVWNLQRDECIARGPGKVLDVEQKKFYFENGYLKVEGAVKEAWLEKIRTAMAECIDRAGKLDRNDPTAAGRLVFEEAHEVGSPRLVRLVDPVMHHDVFKDAMHGPNSPIVDIAEDLLGPCVRTHHGKLNFKWPGGDPEGTRVRWHQDMQFFPHSNYSPLTIGVYIHDVDDSMGPLGVVPGSHKGPLYSLRDADGHWTGYLSDDEVEATDVTNAAYLAGPAGTVTVHNARCIHGSMPNCSPRMRPLLLHTYTAGDALPLYHVGGNRGGAELTPDFAKLIRGQGMWNNVVRLDPRPCPAAPDFDRLTYKPTFFPSQKVSTTAVM